MLFGRERRNKRASDAETHASSDAAPESATQVLDKFGAGDLSHKVGQADAALEAFVVGKNEQWSERVGAAVELRPYSMIAASCWEAQQLGEIYRTSLIGFLGLIPTQPWNVILLAADEQTSSVLQIARYPLVSSEAEMEASAAARRMMIDSLDRLKAAAVASPAHASPEAVRHFTVIRDQVSERIVLSARSFASASLGAPVVDRSRAMFFGD